MRTILAADGYIDHHLEPGETWADFLMEQPNDVFCHVAGWPLCHICYGLEGVMPLGHPVPKDRTQEV